MLAAWLPRRLTTPKPQPSPPIMFLSYIHHNRTRVLMNNILKVHEFIIHCRSFIATINFKSMSQACCPTASFHSTFRRISLLPNNPITISYRLTSIKISLWKTWSIFLPRTSWQSLVRIAFRSTWFSLLHVLRIRRLNATYATQSHEERYWKEAAGGQRDLQRSDARFVGAGARNPKNPALHVPPLVMYYTPALLPEYRDSQRRNGTKNETRSKSPRQRKYEKQAKKAQRKHNRHFRTTV